LKKAHVMLKPLFLASVVSLTLVGGHLIAADPTAPSIDSLIEQLGCKKYDERRRPLQLGPSRERVNRDSDQPARQCGGFSSGRLGEPGA
jgi:hypothetical protein